MKETYQFSEWSSVTRMRHPTNSNWSIEVGYKKLKDDQTVYCLTILETKESPHRWIDVLYRIMVRDNNTPKIEGVWTLTSDEATDALRELGYHCEYVTPQAIPTPASLNSLKALYDLGFSLIKREEKGELKVYHGDEWCSPYSVDKLDMSTTEMDWSWIPSDNTPYAIEALLVQYGVIKG